MSGDTSLCTFEVADRCYGVDVSLVQEVVRVAAVTPVPLARAELVGLINLRGEILPTVDLRRVLGRADRGPLDPVMNVVVRTLDGIVANLLVDVVGDVIDVRAVDHEAVIDGLTGTGDVYFSGAYKLADRLVIELDLQRVLDELAAAAA
jgi:purine-binding chemotaxis protein CheW